MMKTLYKFNYNIICDRTYVKTYDCQEIGATYECMDSSRRFAKNSINSLKKVDGGYEMLSDTYEQGIVLFSQKIINVMEDLMDQYKSKVDECKLIKEKVKVRQDAYIQSYAAQNDEERDEQD